MSELYPATEHDPPPTPLERERLIWLSFAIAAPPLLWALQLLILSAFTNYACFPAAQPLTGPTGTMSWVGVLEIAGDIIAIVVALAAGAVSGRYLSLARGRIRAHAGDPLALWRLDRLCFMALGGLLSSAGFLVAIIFEAIPSVMVVPCGG